MSFGLGFWAAAGSGVSSSYELISTTILGTNTASVTFDVSALTSYKHLQIRSVVRSTRSFTTGGLAIRMNADSGANYSNHWIRGNGIDVSGSEISLASQTEIYATRVLASTSNANTFSPAIIDILDAFSSSKNKTIRTLGGTEGGVNDSRYVSLGSGARYNTASLTSVTIFETFAANFVAGSRFSLYGIKG